MYPKQLYKTNVTLLNINNIPTSIHMFSRLMIIRQRRAQSPEEAIDIDTSKYERVRT